MRLPEPRVSVLTSFLDEARFIGEAIDSVRAQTYSAWELLLIDDGSTDGSSEIAREYARRFPEQIVYLEHPGHRHRGKSGSLNVGLRRARGAFIAILDGDDVWLPHKLQEQVPLLDAHPQAGMMFGRTLFWHSWNGDPRDYVPALGVPANGLLPPPELLVRCLRGQAAVPCTCSVLMRREVIDAVGGFEESFERLFTDQVFYAKMFLAAPVYVADQVWDKYRIRAGSSVATAKSTGTLGAARGRYLDFLAEYVRHSQWRGTEAEQVVRGARWRHHHPLSNALLGRLRAAAMRGRHRAGRVLSEEAKKRLRQRLHPLGGVRLGSLRRVTPFSRMFGYDRGRPVDRYYIERFLQDHADDVRGRVLEVGDDAYTRRFGGDRVTASDILHVSHDAPNATIVDDLATGTRLPRDAFDCIILTQTLHLIFDLGAAIATLERTLKPGGVLLMTTPGISHLDAGRWRDTWYWSLTDISVRRLLGERFPASEVQVGSYGNVLAATAFLYGLADAELSRAELDARDPLYPVVVAARARKLPGGVEPSPDNP